MIDMYVCVYVSMYICKYVDTNNFVIWAVVTYAARDMVRTTIAGMIARSMRQTTTNVSRGRADVLIASTWWQCFKTWATHCSAVELWRMGRRLSGGTKR